MLPLSNHVGWRRTSMKAIAHGSATVAARVCAYSYPTMS